MVVLSQPRDGCTSRLHRDQAIKAHHQGSENGHCALLYLAFFASNILLNTTLPIAASHLRCAALTFTAISILAALEWGWTSPFAGGAV